MYKTLRERLEENYSKREEAIQAELKEKVTTVMKSIEVNTVDHYYGPGSLVLTLKVDHQMRVTVETPEKGAIIEKIGPFEGGWQFTNYLRTALEAEGFSVKEARGRNKWEVRMPI